MSDKTDNRKDILTELQSSSDFLFRLKQCETELPHDAYFEKLEREILQKANQASVRSIHFERWSVLIKAAVLIVLGAVCFWFYQHQSQMTILNPEGLSDQKVINYLVENTEDADFEMIFATTDQNDRHQNDDLEAFNREVVEFLVEYSDDFEQIIKQR